MNSVLVKFRRNLECHPSPEVPVDQIIGSVYWRLVRNILSILVKKRSGDLLRHMKRSGNLLRHRSHLFDTEFPVKTV